MNPDYEQAHRDYEALRKFLQGKPTMTTPPAPTSRRPITSEDVQRMRILRGDACYGGPTWEELADFLSRTLPLVECERRVWEAERAIDANGGPDGGADSSLWAAWTEADQGLIDARKAYFADAT